MKRLVENFRDFIVSAKIHQEPGAWDLYSASPRDDAAEMIAGVIDILRRVKSRANRLELANHMLRKFREEGVKVDPARFMKSCRLS